MEITRILTLIGVLAVLSCDPSGIPPEPIHGIKSVHLDPDSEKIGLCAFHPNGNFGYTSDTSNYLLTLNPVGNWYWDSPEMLVIEMDTAIAATEYNLISLQLGSFLFYSFDLDGKRVFKDLQ